MNKKIISHFKTNDPILYDVIIKSSFNRILIPNTNHFLSLVEDIIGQQLSGKAANTIFGRFEQLFPKKEITTERILNLSDEEIRATGISYAKVSYIKNLAEKVVKKELVFDNFSNLKDEEVIAELIKVKGVGPWTAEMFLMFTLGREDVFSHGDLGLKNAIKRLYRLENPTRDEIEVISSKWSPYKTYACLILWRSLEL